jgi:hypothetical protein
MRIKSRRIRRVEDVAYRREVINAYKNVVVKPEGKRPLGRPSHRWGRGGGKIILK